jgi:transposase
MLGASGRTRNGSRIGPQENNRLFVGAVWWPVRAGAPGRDLPEEFGKWNSVFRRFRRWAKKGVWERLFTELGCLRSGGAGPKAGRFAAAMPVAAKYSNFEPAISRFRGRQAALKRLRGEGGKVWTKPPNCYWQR